MHIWNGWPFLMQASLSMMLDADLVLPAIAVPSTLKSSKCSAKELDLSGSEDGKVSRP